MWVSPQGFNAGVAGRVLRILMDQQPAWLSGVVFGPQVRVSLPELRAAHSQALPHPPLPGHHPQPAMPVPGADWDVAYAHDRGARGHQPASARTRRRSSACSSRSPTPASSPIPKAATTTSTRSSGARSAGTREADVTDVLRDYGRYFIGPDHGRRLRAGAAGAGAQLARAAARPTPAWTTTLAAVPGHGAQRHAATEARTGASSRRSTAPTTTPICAPG